MVERAPDRLNIQGNKPPMFYLSLAEKLLSSHEMITIHSLGSCIEAAVTVGARLEKNDLAKTAKIETSRSGRKDNTACLVLTMKRTPAFFEKYEEQKKDRAKRAEETGEDWTPLDKLNVKTAEGKKDKHGEVMVNSKGHLLKPFQSGARSEAEAKAYKHLSKSPIAKYLPGYYGTRTYDGSKYLELENILFGLEAPMAQVDIKMGRKTYEESATAEKKKKEDAKINPGKCSELGFRLVGCKAGEYELSHVTVKEKGGLTPEEFINDGMKPFFCKAGTKEIDRESVDYFMAELKGLLEVMEKGYGGVLRAASIFMAREMKPGGNRRLRIIDLAHYTSTKGTDENFIEGLKNLIKHLSTL